MRAPAICSGNGTCDPRVPHICYNGADDEWANELAVALATPAEVDEAAKA